ncbi:MAG: YbgC/FadM family acyl-CoA thioesterase [Myxococcota bacterium]
MSTTPFVHLVEVYYEDTDHSGAVYHANYLKYMERAREHMLGREALVQLWEDRGKGYVVYKAELTYKEPAKFGDTLEVRTTVEVNSAWRAIFQQNVHRQSDGALLVEGKLHLVCVDKNGDLTRLPTEDMLALGADV